MDKAIRGRRLRTAVTLAVLFCGFVVIMTIVSYNERYADRHGPPVRLGEAEALLDEVVRLARTGDFDGLCATADPGRRGCESVLTFARQEGKLPGPMRPEVVGATTYPGSEISPHYLVLHLRGTRADGSPYTSDFAVYRTSGRRDSRTVGTSMPVYWTGVTFQQASPCPGDESSADGSVCAQATVSPLS